MYNFEHMVYGATNLMIQPDLMLTAIIPQSVLHMTNVPEGCLAASWCPHWPALVRTPLKGCNSAHGKQHAITANVPDWDHSSSTDGSTVTSEVTRRDKYIKNARARAWSVTTIYNFGKT